MSNLQILIRRIATAAILANLLGLSATATAATFTVNSADDDIIDGDGLTTLREAIIQANANADLDSIQFSVGSGPITIELRAPLPTVIYPLKIDGTTQPGAEPLPRVRIDGAGSTASPMLRLTVPSGCIIGDCSIRGLALVNGKSDAMRVDSGEWVIAGNYIGIDGSTAMPNTGSGLLFYSSGSRIGGNTAADRNLFSGNGKHGIEVNGNANLVAGNYIGLDATGSTAVANGLSGIRISGDNNLIGQSTAAYGNVISGNTQRGILIETTATGSLIRNNRVGTNAAGDAAVPNGMQGVQVNGGATQLGISGAGNQISGNTGTGVQIGSGLSDVFVQGNLIGTNPNGTAALGNQGHGVSITTNTNLLVGGTTAGDRNVIAGNGGSGINFGGTSHVNTRVLGNYIGTNANGTAAIPNDDDGISGNGSGDIVFGAAAAGAGNVISGNGRYGIQFYGNSTGVKVQGNRIGTTADGTGELGNASTGVRVSWATNTVVGGNSPAEGNLISGNGGGGVTVESLTVSTQVLHNWIGVDVGGTYAIPNEGGLGIAGVSTIIGYNVISGNNIEGASISGATVDSITLVGNFIGTTSDGGSALGNDGIGLRIINGTNLYIGIPVAGGGNVISANILRNLTLEGGVDGAIVSSNRIGTNVGGDTALTPDAEGISIGGLNITVTRNLVSGNSGSGISVGGAPDGISIVGNYIGTDLAGTTAVPNGGGLGVHGGSNISIGGSTSDERNLISGNLGGGIGISGDADGVDIRGNYIGTTPNGQVALPNGSYAIRAISGANVNIGGTQAGEGNLISGNSRGIAIEPGMSGVSLQGNTIGLNSARNAKLPNSNSSGIDVFGGSVLIGGTDAGAGNVIAGADASGIGVWAEDSSGVIIQGNWIGTTPGMASNLGNKYSGIDIKRTEGLLVGGFDPGEANIIAYNGDYGIVLDAGEGNGFLGNRYVGNVQGDIELNPRGPQENDDLDLDAGANHLQNFPVFTSATANGAQVSVQGVLDSAPSSNFLIEITHAAACHPNGMGAGNETLGVLFVQTDANGHASFSGNLPLATTSGVLSATATSMDGSTSEFSPCHGLTGPSAGVFQFWDGYVLTWEGQAYVDIAVVRSMGSIGTASVRVTTQDGSAFAPDDYGSVDEILTFEEGVGVRTVRIPIEGDALNEPQENFTVNLSQPTGGATLAGVIQTAVQIINTGTGGPGYVIDDADGDEPATGQSDFVFSVTMSPNAEERTIHYQTANGTAVAGMDYVETSGDLVFPPSDVTQTLLVAVPVMADAEQEEDEVFYVEIGHSGGLAFGFKTQGLGVIRNTVPPPSPDIFKDSFEY